MTFLVNIANPTSDGWTVSGEPGLGPPREGDAFSFAHHEDDHIECARMCR
jgi:hypothetical protein